MPKGSHHPTDGLASLPSDVELVWHGVNDAINLRQFLASEVTWCELDVNVNLAGNDLILRHDSYAELPMWADEQPLMLRDVLPILVHAGKSIKLDFKASRKWHDAILAMVDETELSQDRLWLNADFDTFGHERIQSLADRYPGAVIQVPLHSLSRWTESIEAVYEEALAVASLGVNRFSVGWSYPDVPAVVTTLRSMGYEANIYGVRNLAKFLLAIDLHPKSVTADFNFPEWGYFGRGSGHGGHFWRYVLEKATI